VEGVTGTNCHGPRGEHPTALTTQENIRNTQAILDSLSDVPRTVLVFYRGVWCPFCQGYLRELNTSFYEQVTAQGGRLIGITAQGAEAAAQAQEAWGLRYPVVSAPDNALAQSFEVFITPKADTPLAEDPNAYPNGMAQPAVIALNQDGKIVYRWAINPNQMNLFGAADRPLPAELWAGIQAGLRGEPQAEFNGARLDPEFLKDNYPAQYEAFQQWVAAVQAANAAQ